MLQAGCTCVVYRDAGLLPARGRELCHGSLETEEHLQRRATVGAISGEQEASRTKQGSVTGIWVSTGGVS
jgi:hypothetical protein